MGIKVEIIKPYFAEKLGTIYKVRGEALDNETGLWMTHLEGGEPFNLPGETIQDVGSVNVPNHLLKIYFKEI